jgi:hypothetical protein
MRVQCPYCPWVGEYKEPEDLSTKIKNKMPLKKRAEAGLRAHINGKHPEKKIDRRGAG